MRRLAFILVLLAAAGCARQELTLLSDSELPDDIYSSPEPTPSISPLPEHGFIYLVRRGPTQRGATETGTLERRRITFQEGGTRSLPEELLTALFLQVIEEDVEPSGRPRDPTPLTTEIPEGTRLNELTIAGPVATVDLSAEFEQAAPPLEQALRLAQVVYTLTEGTGITHVRFRIEGDPLDSVPIAQSGQVTRTSVPVGREHYRQFDPTAEPEEPEG